ncbi:MAG: hypothetical protein HY089_07385, partial [Ignavibacteriales bacterium]|nr:hypothetical protein [Ignavibacteriales bacterium]
MTSRILTINKEQPRNVFALNGTWEIHSGVSEAIPRGFKHTVPVPGLVDLAEHFYDWDTPNYHHYRTVFRIDAPEQTSHAYIKIDQAQYGTTVWLNRREIGNSISCYTSQEYRLDDALRWGDDNELMIRVGARRNLPPESAVGKDQEKEKFIPGIWGDVSLIVCQSPRIKYVQIIPHIASSVAEVRLTVENPTDQRKKGKLVVKALERASKKESSKPAIIEIILAPGETKTAVVELHIEDMKLWSPDAPFLYEVESVVLLDDAAADEIRTAFGMREFTVRGKGFFLNGKRIFLKGGNIAFHRFLSDKERKHLPWDRAWIKRVLIDIPKAHHFNFFRAHLGQMYSAWYDIADEKGMLLQNEWQFWGRTGTKEQIKKEFSEWLRDNWNHPSIIIWDALNESSDDEVQNDIIPEM